MGVSLFRLFPSLRNGLARRVIFGMMLLTIAATPAALDLCAKDKRRAKAAKEQRQEEAGKVEAKDQPKEIDQSKVQTKDDKDQSKDPAKDKDLSKETLKDKDAGADKAKDQENDKTKESSKPQDKPQDKVTDKTTDKAKVARTVDDRSRPVVSLKEAKPPIAPALEAARASRDAIRKIPGYTCTFSKLEQLKKGSPIRQTMSLKFRREPFSVYLKFVDPNAGREVIYVEGRNNGKLQVHEASGLTSLIGTINLSPTGSEALKVNKYPLTMIGMENMLGRFISDWEESQKHADTKVQLYPQAKLGVIECTMYEVTHPEQREPFKFHKTRVYFDKRTLLPVRAEQFAFPAKSGAEPQLIEEYTYTDVKPDPTLSETDFDVNNEKYGFK